MTLYLWLRLVLGQLLRYGEEYQLRLGRLMALGIADCHKQSATPAPIPAQLQPNRSMVLVMEGRADRAWADW